MKKLFISITWKMMAGFLAINLISIVAMYGSSHYYFQKVIEKNFGRQSQQMSANISQQMELYFNQIMQTTSTLLVNNDVQQFLNQNDTSVDTIEELIYNMNRYTVLNYHEIIGSFLLSKDGKIVSSNGKFYSAPDYYSQEPWFHFPLEQADRIYPTHQVHYPQQDVPVISLVVPIHGVQSLDVIGNLIMDINISQMEKNIQVAAGNDMFYIVSNQGDVVYAPNSDWLGKPVKDTVLDAIVKKTEGYQPFLYLLNGEEWLVSVNISNFNQWKVISMTPYSELTGGLIAATRSTLITLFILSLFIMIAVPVYSRSIVRPIQALRMLMKKVAAGNLSVQARISNQNDEIQELNTGFNQMVTQLNELIETVYVMKNKEMQLLLKQEEAVIQSLQNQINPHLLYNSLDIIKSMAYIEKNHKIEEISRNLADLYRYNARINDVTVSLRDELDHVIKYLKIVKIRFPLYFQYQINVNEKFHQCSCIKLMIQPIVENAVKHSVEVRGGDGAIIVSAFDEGSDLIVEIADNGAGISKDRLSYLKDELAKISSGMMGKNHRTIGITNVHARLVLLYGAGYGIRIDSFPDQGTVVSLRIPFLVHRVIEQIVE